MSPSFTLADFRKDLSPKYKLVPLLDKAIADFDEEWEFKYEPKRGDLFWHPSGHCTPKPSDLYDLAHDRLNGAPEDREFKRKMAKFGPVGHFWHQFLQHIMVRYDMVSADAIERSANKGWDLGGDKVYAWEGPDMEKFRRPFHACVGSADVAPWTHKGNDYIVDFKTMSSRSFQAVTLPPGFAAKYECQMNVYMDFFDYDRALIVAVNKDTPHDFKEFEFRRNQPLIDVIYDKWKFVAECLQDEDRPDADDDQGFELPLEWS
jgi:hypothetical protein